MGLYYYGARYLDAKYSRWLSTDPAVSDYIPMAPVNDEAKKHNQSLPGMGGVFNVVNLQLYHYAGNNPVKYTDPDGRDVVIFNRSYGAGGYGHNAILIGDDENGWTFFSKDGVGENTYKTYATLNDFLEDNSNALYKDQYDNAARIETSKEADVKMKEKGKKIFSRDYALEERNDKNGNRKQNCADLVADILSEVNIFIGKPKIKKGDKSREGPYVWIAPYGSAWYFGKAVSSPFDTNITWPNKQFDNFKEKNGATDVAIP